MSISHILFRKKSLKRRQSNPNSIGKSLTFQNAPRALTDDNGQKNDRGGYLKIGDIISLQSKEEMTLHGSMISYSGVIFGDGVAYIDLECIPRQLMFSKNQNVQFRQSLFRIEPAHQYGFIKQYKLAQETTTDAAVLAHLKQKCDEEIAANEAELESSYGRTITYGERLQLRHLHSNFFITASINIAKEHGCLKIVLADGGNEGSWLEILPSNKLRQEGEPIRYIDKFILSSRVEKSNYYLHMGTSTIYREEMQCELNASDTTSLWKALKYISYTEIKKNPLLVSSGDSLTIYSQHYGGYLSVSTRDISELLPPDLDLGMIQKEEDMECLLFFPKLATKFDMKSKDKLEVFIESERSGRCLWELERTNPFIGGVAMIDEYFRIKHVGTGMYLEINRNGNISIKPDPISDFNIFQFEYTGEVKDQLNFTNQVRIKGKNTELYLGAVEVESLSSFLKLESSDAYKKIPLKSYKDDKNLINTTFVLIDVSEHSTMHIYQISRIIPKVLDFYHFLREWGMLKVSELHWIPNYDLALMTEPDLQLQVERISEIMFALNRRILDQNENDLNSMIRIQETIKDTGLLDLFLKLAGLISKRIAWKKDSNDSYIKSRPQDNLNKTPEDVAEKYLLVLIKKLYNTIYNCIKNNPTNCEVLKKYDEFLSFQLGFYKSEVSLLLKETFKHSVDIMNKVSIMQFGIWADQITVINEAKGDIVDQTLILMILSSFCVHKNKGLQKYQRLIETNLFSNICKINLLDFVTVNQTECIGFFPGNDSFKTFLTNNPTLMSMYENLIQHPITKLSLIPITSLNSSKLLINYVAAFVELLSNLCLSRYEPVKPKIQESFEITSHYIMSLIKNQNLNLKLRTRFIKLARVMFIDLEPTTAISKSKDHCVVWTSDLKMLSHNNTELQHFPIPTLASWLIETWVNPTFPAAKDSNNSSKSKLKFTIELLQITRALLDLQYLDFDFFISVYPSLVKLLFDYSKDSIIKISIEDHWCRALKMEISSLPIERVNNMLTWVLKIFKVANCIRRHKEIEMILISYRRYLDLNDPKADITEFVVEFTDISNQFDFSKAMFSNSLNQNSRIIAGSAFLSALHRDLPLKLSSSIPQNELYQLDSCLLSLLFKNSQKSIEVKALNLILENFNHRSNLLRELDEVHLLYIESQHNLYMAMKSSIRSLNEIFTRLVNQIETLRLEADFLDPAIEVSFIDSILANIKQLGSILNISQPREHLIFAQGIARNLKLQEIILKFILNLDHPWVKKEGSRLTIPGNWKFVYRSIVHTLFSFAFKNSKNQLILYPRLSSIVLFFGNSIGITTLISEILSCKKDNAAIERVIAYIFSLIGANGKVQDKPHDLKMLLNLIVDEKKSIKSFIQINVVKALVSSQAILAYYTRENVVDFSKYEMKDTRFHATMVLMLANCCINNEFAIKQCQRILPYSIVIREIIERRLNYKLKKAYLHFLVFAYMNKKLCNTDYNCLEDLFIQVIIPDLINFKDYIDSLPSIALKNKYKSVSYRKEIRIEQNNKDFIVKEYLEDGEPFVLNQEALTDEEKEARGYWKYLINAKPWKIEIVTGLLIFIHDLCIEMSFSQYNPNAGMQKALEKVLQLVMNLKDSVQELSEKFPRLSFEFLLDTISVSLSEIPTSFNVEYNQEEINNSFFVSIMKELSDLMKSSGLPADLFVANKLKITEKTITLNDLTLKCKRVTSKNLKINNIFKGLSMLGPVIDVSVFTEEIQKMSNMETIKRAYSICASFDSSQQVHLNSKLKSFVADIEKHIGADGTFELTALVNQVKLTVVDVALKNKDFTDFYKFTKNLENAFNNPDHKVYLMEIFRQMIMKEKKTELPPKEKLARVQLIQQALISANIPELCLIYLNNDSEHVLANKALKLLHQLLDDCQAVVKESVLSTIKQLGIGHKFLSYIRGILNQATDRILESKSEEEYNCETCKDILFLLTQLCSQCFEPFQLYLLDQNDDDQRISIDIVSEVVKFTYNFQGLAKEKIFQENPTLLQSIWIKCFKLLTFFCQGPCMKNQIAISNNKQIYSFINWITDVPDTNTPAFLELLCPISEFLLSLLEGDTSVNVITEMFRVIDINRLLQIATDVYFNHIKCNLTMISQENADSEDSQEIRIIKLGFNLTVLFLKMQDRFPNSPKVKRIFSTTSDDVHENIEDNEAYNYQEAILMNLKSFWQKLVNVKQQNSAGSVDFELKRFNEAHFYYSSNIGSVEILFKSKLCKIFFRTPPMCKFLTQKSRQDMLIKIKRNSQQEKIEDFFDKSKIFEFEMKYQQSLNRFNVLAKVVSYWNFYGFVAFISVVAINITLLVYYDKNNYQSNDKEVNGFLIFCGTLQLISAILYTSSYVVEYFPVIKQREISSIRFLTEDELKTYQRVKGTLLMRSLLNLAVKIHNGSIFYGFRFILKDFQLFYCLIYLIISVICWYHPLLYSILLLDLIKRNDTLINILKSISLNYRQILLTLLLGLIIVFIYSTFYMLFFSSEFDFVSHDLNEKYVCQSLQECFFTVLDSGVRAGGGVGDILISYTNLNYKEVLRIITDLTFFVIVVIVLLNIIFGIIIDTFAELRDQRNDLIRDLKEKCFICGNTRFQFELKRINWKLHVHLHHSLYSYLAFLVYIRQKKLAECNGVERYTKEKISLNDSNFIPRTSISLQKFEDELKDSQEKLYEKYVRKLRTIQNIFS